MLMFQITNFSTIGGANVKECTRRILRYLMTNNCGRFVNWKGRGGKVAFSQMTVCSIIISECIDFFNVFCVHLSY